MRPPTTPRHRQRQVLLPRRNCPTACRKFCSSLKANVGDETIIAYIKNSGNSYGLNADQIIYLRQQGVSDAVVRTMLNQPQTGNGRGGQENHDRTCAAAGGFET